MPFPVGFAAAAPAPFPVDLPPAPSSSSGHGPVGAAATAWAAWYGTARPAMPAGPPPGPVFLAPFPLPVLVGSSPPVPVLLGGNRRAGCPSPAAAAAPAAPLASWAWIHEKLG